MERARAGTRWTDGKQNGAGSGFFEYRLAWPKDLAAEAVAGATFVAELGAKELFGKDRADAGTVEGDFMRARARTTPGATRTPTR